MRQASAGTVSCKHCGSEEPKGLSTYRLTSSALPYIIRSSPKAAPPWPAPSGLSSNPCIFTACPSDMDNKLNRHSKRTDSSSAMACSGVAGFLRPRPSSGLYVLHGLKTMQGVACHSDVLGVFHLHCCPCLPFQLMRTACDVLTSRVSQLSRDGA